MNEEILENNEIKTDFINKLYDSMERRMVAIYLKNLSYKYIFFFFANVNTYF